MATGNVPITAGSGTLVRVVTNAAVDSGANQQVMSLAGQDGVLIPTDPDGSLQVSPEPSGLFVDDFSSGALTNYNTLGTAPTVTGGVMTPSAATTASLVSTATTGATFNLRSGSYLLTAFLIKLEAAALVNNTRWWGFATPQGSPTAAAPIVNGAVFLIDYTNGGLYAAVYSAGTRTVFTAITRPSDAGYHRYEIRYRQSVIYWVIDGVTVASTSQPNIAVAVAVKASAGSVNFTTAPSSAPTWSVTSIGVSDLSAINKTISDGVNPSVQARVVAASTAPSTLDPALVVTLSPLSSSTTVGNIGQITTGVVPGTGATSLGKARSAVTGTADTGVAAFGIRQAATPVAMASAAAAWSPFIVDTEGKIIIAGTADSALNWQNVVVLTSTSATAVRAAAAAGIRNFVTDFTISNSSTTGTIVTLLDGANTMWQGWVGPNGQTSVSLRTPLRGTAATAVQVQLGTAVSSVYVTALGYVGI